MMNRVLLAAVLAVVLAAAAGTIWLGADSGLFRVGGVSAGGYLLLLGPYVLLAALAWGHRHSRPTLAALLAVSVALGGFGLWMFYTDWHSEVVGPRPTNPNPWRLMVPVVVTVAQWSAFGLVALVLTGWWLWRRYRRAPIRPYARGAGFG